MDISVVIGSYNQQERLTRVLDGFLNQKTVIDFEVIVVDSFSTDGTDEMVQSFSPENFSLRFIQRENPSGKAEARNVGVLESKSDIIIITDADMIPDENFVQSHFNAHKASNTPCCFEGLAYNLQSYDWPPESVQNLPTQVAKKYKDGDRLDWYYFLTGNLSFPKSYFNLEKGFSLDFKNYGWEDLELGYRLKKRGLPLYYLTSAVNYHYHVITHEEQVDRKFHMGQSAQIFIKKHPELKLFLGFNPLSIIIRKSLSKSGVIFRFISTLKQSKWSFLRSFSYWFQAEFNYLSGLLSLDFDS